MEILVETEDEFCLINLSHEIINDADVALLENTIKDLFVQLTMENREEPFPVLVNTSSLKFISSSGIATFVGLTLDSRHRQIQLGFHSFSPKILMLIQRMKLDSLLTIFSNEEEGRQAFSSYERSSPRFPCQLRSELLVHHHLYTGECRNISKGGCCVVLANEITEAIPAQVILKEINFETQANIVRCQPFASKYEIGLEFSRKDDRFQEEIDQIIQTLKKTREWVKISEIP